VPFLKNLAPPAAAFVALVSAWELGSRLLHVPLYLLPPPSAIARAAVTELPTLMRAASVTARASFLGLTLSAFIGGFVAVLMSTSRFLERAIYPYAVFLQTVPIVAIAPLLVLWFGAGLRAVTVSAFIVSVFPVIANTLAGIRSVDGTMHDLFRLYRASRAATMVKLELPAALPNFVTGLRVAAGLAVIGAIVGEFVAGFSESGAGLGILILASYRDFRTDLLFASVLFAAAVGLVLFGLVSLLGQLFLSRWHPSAEAR
jgi:NitT/TauT family transport system permease protein